MTVLRNNFGELLEPGLATVYFNEFDRYEKEYVHLYNIRKSEKKFEEDLQVVGLGVMPQKNEGQSTTYEDIEQGYLRTFTHTTYSKGVRITQEMYEDDLYGIMHDLTGALARSAYQRMEVDGASVLNNAFSSSFTGSDGVSLINSSHTLASGGTAQSNALSTGADLNASSLQEAIQILEDTKDEKGLNVAIRAKLLVVPTALQWTAAELLGSEYKPGTTDNEINAIRGKGLTYIVNHYLTDSDAWFVLGDRHKLKWWDRVPMSFYKGNDFDTDDCKFKARFRKSNGFSGWRGITGDAGV